MTTDMTPGVLEGTWDVKCAEHGLDRRGLAEAHAQNLVRKHDREDHAQPAFQVGLVAALVLTLREDMLDAARDHSGDPDKGWTITLTWRRYESGLAAWMTLLGLQAGQEDAALALARQHAEAGTVAHVAPF